MGLLFVDDSIKETDRKKIKDELGSVFNLSEENIFLASCYIDAEMIIDQQQQKGVLQYVITDMRIPKEPGGSEDPFLGALVAAKAIKTIGGSVKVACWSVNPSEDKIPEGSFGLNNKFLVVSPNHC